ncbi:hypothetical protein P7C70_g6636, partial [Phenoliferia sp. Uapishka_3]
MDLALLVKRVEITVREELTTRTMPEVTITSKLSPSLSLSLALALAPDVQEIYMRLPPSAFTFMATTINIMQPTLRALHLFTHSEFRGSPLDSRACVELLRGLPCLQELSIGSKFIIDAWPVPEPVTFQLTHLAFRVPHNTLVTTGPETFTFVTSSSTHSLQHLRLVGPFLPSVGDDNEAIYDLEPFDSLQTLEISPGYPGDYGYDDETDERRLDAELAQVHYLIDQILSIPLSVQHLTISDYDDNVSTIRGDIIDKESLLWNIPHSCWTVKLRLEHLKAKTLLDFLTSEDSATLKWTHLSVVTERCFHGVELKKIVEQCEKKRITFVCRGNPRD